MNKNTWDFIPISREDLVDRQWYWYDFLVVTGDAYVDHPSFGTAVIARCLEKDGFRVAILAQPNFRSVQDFEAIGKPRLGVLIGAGNLDSMVAKYTAAKRKRSEDFYSPNKKAGLRPDRATLVYSKLAREAYGEETPIIIGGLEASLRRFAHYDYWDDKVRPSFLVDSGADLLVYGMGEKQTREIASRLKKKEDISTIRDIRGTAFVAENAEECLFEEPVMLPSFEQTAENRRFYAEATRKEYIEHDHVIGHALMQPHGDKLLVVNPPATPLNTAELDEVFELPYTREVHPIYEQKGGVPAIDEVRFSVIHNRGCFGACNFCALAFHQGRAVTSRSHESILREVESMTKHPEWKGYVNDVGGPTANFRTLSCKKQEKHGMCPDRKCLSPEPCKNLNTDHSDYLNLLRKIRGIDGVKRVFIRSGIRYDFMLCDKKGEFFSEMVKHHISGQLKVAPEHCIDSVLDYMGKPHIETYEKFYDKYFKLSGKHGKEQYVVPYLMSSHPGSKLTDAVKLAEYLVSKGTHPEQVQDFYPTPGTISTCMYHAEINPMTMKSVYVPKSQVEKSMQRALLQWRRPENRALIMKALHETGREDLVGYGKQCLLRPYKPPKTEEPTPVAEKTKVKRGKGWAKPKQKTKPGKRK